MFNGSFTFSAEARKTAAIYAGQAAFVTIILKRADELGVELSMNPNDVETLAEAIELLWEVNIDFSSVLWAS